MAFAFPKIRDDLVYTRREEDGATVVFIRDPLRATFFRFNELQAAMMRALDGTQSAEAIAVTLANDFGYEVPVAAVRSFTSRLERHLLLDITSYRVNEAAVRRRIRKRIRALRRAWQSAGAGRPASAPAADSLFEEGLARIEGADPALGASHLAAALEVDPGHERAKEALRAVHEAFFRGQVQSGPSLFTLPLFNPDALLARLDRRIGRWVFSRWGVLALLALLWASVQVSFDISLPELASFQWRDLVVAYLLFNTLGYFIHELGHGLACKHYGGEVGELGVGTMYGVVLIAYCDTSSTYLFKERRHKVIVQLAGLLLQTGLWSLPLFLWSQLASDAFALRKAALLSVGYQMVQHIYTVTPFVKSDGYYALCDGLGVLNLRERAFNYLGGWLKATVLGLPSRSEPATRSERALFVGYALLGTAVTAVLIYGAWFNVVLPLVIRYLGGVGLAAAVVYALWKWGPPVCKGLFQLGRAVWAHRREVFTARRSLGLGGALTLVTTVLLWPWPLMVDGEVVLLPVARAGVYAQEPGLLDRLSLREGERVKAGQVLAVLRNDELLLERARAAAEVELAALRLQRWQQVIRPEEQAAARARVQASRARKTYAARRARRERQLGAAGVSSHTVGLRAQQAALLARHGETDARIASTLLEEGARPEELRQAQAALEKARALLAALDVRVARLTLRSPLDGVVVGPRVEERWRQRLAQGEPLCEVHSLSQLHGEIRVGSNELLVGIAEGHPVALRAAADPGREVTTFVRRVSPAAHGAGLTLETEAFDNPGWPSKLHGRARVYGPPRALAYQWVAAPVLRLLDFRLWRLWG